jgi:hypothetical protein
MTASDRSILFRQAVSLAAGRHPGAEPIRETRSPVTSHVPIEPPIGEKPGTATRTSARSGDANAEGLTTRSGSRGGRPATARSKTCASRPDAVQIFSAQLADGTRPWDRSTKAE